MTLKTPPLPPVRIEPDSQGFLVMRGEKPLLTPAGSVLHVATRALAEKIADEWTATQGKPDPARMPIYALCVTMQDRVAEARATLTDALMEMIETDLCCYRAVLPPDLALRQAAVWDPLLSDITRLAGVDIPTTTGLGALDANKDVTKSVRALVEGLTLPAFTVLQVFAPLLGSVYIALLLVRGRLDLMGALAAVFVEEDYWARQDGLVHYGPDPDVERRKETLRAELSAGLLFLQASAPLE